MYGYMEKSVDKRRQVQTVFSSDSSSHCFYENYLVASQRQEAAQGYQILVLLHKPASLLMGPGRCHESFLLFCRQKPAGLVQLPMLIDNHRLKVSQRIDQLQTILHAHHENAG